MGLFSSEENLKGFFFTIYCHGGHLRCCHWSKGANACSVLYLPECLLSLGQAVAHKMLVFSTYTEFFREYLTRFSTILAHSGYPSYKRGCKTTSYITIRTLILTL